MIWLAAAFALLFLIIGLGFILLEPKILFHPATLPEGALEELLANAPELKATFEEVTFPTEDGETLVGWIGRPEKPRAWLLWFHGNGGCILGRWSGVKRFVTECCLGVFIVDYRGYGRSSGRPRERGLYRDSRAALAFLKSRGVTERDLFLFGRSLGAAVAVELATEVHVRGLILESAFTSIREMSQVLFPWFPAGWFVRNHFSNVNRIGKVDAPILMIHGRRDELVPFSQGEHLAAVAPKERTTFVPVDLAGHSDVPDVMGIKYHETICSFIEAHRVKEEAAPTGNV